MDLLPIVGTVPATESQLEYVTNADDEPGGPYDIENSECSASMNITLCHPQLQVESHVSDTPHDIANGLEDEPVQQHNVVFPKHSGQSFSPFWFKKHLWLEYSVARDAVFCPCQFFAVGVHKSEECFIKTGYKNWKNATGKTGRLAKHTVTKTNSCISCLGRF